MQDIGDQLKKLPDYFSWLLLLNQLQTYTRKINVFYNEYEGYVKHTNFDKVVIRLMLD